MSATEKLTRGDTARRAGVNRETLRYYERRGLLPKPSRSLANYRLYDVSAVRRVRFVKRAQELGFSLAEIKELLALRAASGAASGARAETVRRKVGDKIDEIEEKIRTLKAMRKTLARLRRACSGGGPVSACPILEALDGEAATSPGRASARSS